MATLDRLVASRERRLHNMGHGQRGGTYIEGWQMTKTPDLEAYRQLIERTNSALLSSRERIERSQRWLESSDQIIKAGEARVRRL